MRFSFTYSNSQNLVNILSTFQTHLKKRLTNIKQEFDNMLYFYISFFVFYCYCETLRWWNNKEKLNYFRTVIYN